MTMPVHLDHARMQKLLAKHVPPEPVGIVSFPDRRLARIAKAVTDVDEAVQAAALTMLQLHYATPRCAALAATQLSFKQPWAITVIDYSPEHNQPLVLINPKLSDFRGEQHEMEGCMSVYPDHVHEAVKRALQIKVQALDFFGQPLAFEAEGFFAKCIQHEVDHLNGKIYLDRVSSLKRNRLTAQIRAAQKQIKRQSKGASSK